MRPAVLSGLRNVAASGVSGMDRAFNEDRIRLAVTGLSRAGKTVFITSLIHNLLALGHGRNTLPLLGKRLTQNGATRLRRVEVLPAGAAIMPSFDYATKLEQLAAAAPAWPPRTEDLAEISLGLELERASALGRRLGTRRVRLDILDYPGEWLLDLPLLNQGYAAWSAQTLALLRTPPREASCRAFLSFIDHLHASDRAEEALLHRGHLLYKAALLACRTEHDLRYLQPGRFVCPGPGSDAPYLWFFPLSAEAGPVKPGSNGALLQQRFDAYKQHVRATFFDTHFASFDRQVMLVDVLGALYAGQAAFADTARVIGDLARALRYGGNAVARALVASAIEGAGHLLPSGLGRLADSTAHKLTNRRIEHLVFVATKADHVPALRRDNLLHLLRALSSPGSTEPAGQGARVSHRVAAAILSTKDGVVSHGETTMEVVEGIVMGDTRLRPFYVGDVPASMPPPGFWTNGLFRMPVFRPPPIDPDGAAGIPHLNLDQVLDDVIGDLL